MIGVIGKNQQKTTQMKLYENVFSNLEDFQLNHALSIAIIGVEGLVQM